MANTSGRLIGGVLAASMAYAIFRYHIAGPVPWTDLPFFIVNKGLALGGFLLIGLNFTLGPARNLGLPVPQAWLDARKALGMTGFLVILVHALMSFMLFSPATYPSLFELDGTMTGAAGISMLAGVVGFVFLWVMNLSFQTRLGEDRAFIEFITSRRTLVWALMLGGVHLVFMGYRGWLAPEGWHGNLPPISLVGFGAFVICYGINLAGRE